MKVKLLFFVCLLGCLNFGFSQDGSPDTTFGDNGVVITDINDVNEYVTNVAQSTLGRIVVIGHYNQSSLYYNFMAAYLEDGNMDTTFANNGLLVNEVNSEQSLIHINFQSDEKILGGLNSENYTLYRLLPSGLLDTTFGNNGYLLPFNINVERIKFNVDPNNKIIVFGQQIVNNIITVLVKRFLPDGGIDTTFGVNGEMNYPIGTPIIIINSSRLESNEHLIVDYRLTENDISSNFIVQFLPDGTLDQSFGNNGKVLVPVDEEFYCSSLSLSDGEYLISCSYLITSDGSLTRKMLKLLQNGTLNTDFGSEGYLTGSTGSIVQGNQRIIGDYSNNNWESGITPSYFRYFANGTFDGSFQFSSNYPALQTAYTIPLNSGKFLIAGNSFWTNSEINIILQKFNNNPLSIPENTLKDVVIYPNPSKGVFNLILEEEVNTSYSITDITGKTIQKGNASNLNSQIDLSFAQDGIYFFNTNFGTFRLIKD